MSLGGTGSSLAQEDAVNKAWANGVIVVAAVGNSNSSGAHYPSDYKKVISVAATDQNDAKASYSNYGSKVDVAAPGSSILSTTRDGSYGLKSGTSMASPHVAGLAALV
jgi:thermitase